ncbi:MAG: hypothetical protein EOR01_23560 [Mesorhizobium sp.]|uniref:hypothetical protein n=1 Tax=Mesorhizobium sp. TaxID=1871066 RepID=UPI000FE46204|nr:hypothetical protein [Mesorhizobium sp.]RWP18004.1 MAG: hypothetical protein EOR01_23560 [Mesorhizobium sp.]
MTTMRTLLLVTALLISQIASAAEGVHFPDLDTEGYCTALVSKMLVNTEQQAEKENCLVEEKQLRAALLPFWYLVDGAEAGKLKDDYIKEVRFQTYITFRHFVATALGKACLEGRVFCAPDQTTVELAAFKSASYCPSRGCVKEETARRLRLEKYWVSLPKRKTAWCLGHVFNQRLPPLQILSNCVAEDIGTQCLTGARQCWPG